MMSISELPSISFDSISKFLVFEVEEVREQVREWRQQGLTVGFVPTMGFLHEGHLSLIDLAKQHVDRVVVSVYVNPTQFSENEDLDEYPADLSGDCEKVIERGGDLLFAPVNETIYLANDQTVVELSDLTQPLCGESRETHFRGVSTILTKLFNIVLPDVACFGKKDYQQLQVVRQLVRDLHFPIEVLAGETIREEDGVAMSSRNSYLTPHERISAKVLSDALLKAKSLFERGCTNPKMVQEEVLAVIRSVPGAEVEYCEVRNPETLRLVEEITLGDRVFLAVRFGDVRLIDNAPLGLSCSLSRSARNLALV